MLECFSLLKVLHNQKIPSNAISPNAAGPCVTSHTLSRIYVKVLTFGSQHKHEFYLDWLVEDMLAECTLPVILDTAFVNNITVEAVQKFTISPSEYESTSLLLVVNRDSLEG